jgi:hypothetical protein
MTYTTRKEAKEAGWFSRRHRTSEAHEGAVAKRNAFRGKWARRRAAEERQAIWDALSDAERAVKIAAGRTRYLSTH